MRLVAEQLSQPESASGVSSPNGVSLELIRTPLSEPPILVVVIDTEEQFDWNLKFSREATDVSAMSKIGIVQNIFDQYGVRPLYAIDYPVAITEQGYAPIREYCTAGKAQVGAHLHAWVNPPYDEEIGAINSFSCNLPQRLETAKLGILTHAIERNVGIRPKSYKAGRYGFGRNTPAILQEHGFDVDLSPNPPFDYSPFGGPDFSSFPVAPYWINGEREILGLPCTGAYVGYAGRFSHTIYRAGNVPVFRKMRLRAMLARVRAVDRLRLSPENYTLQENKKLTRYLYAQGIRTFNLSFHSPTLVPGCTEYVRSNAELDRFLACLSGYLEFFLGEFGGITMTPSELYLKMVSFKVC